MELTHLKDFYEVARCGTFSGAAVKLHISQPALSRKIASLEDELGITLFSRHSRGVFLTEAGQRLFNYTENILKLVNDAQKIFHDINNLEHGTLSIGASTTIGTYLLPFWLAEFIHQHPQIDLSVQVQNSNKIIAKVLTGDVDLAFVAGPLKIHGLCIETILEDEIVLISSPHHPLANKKPLSISSLVNETFVLRENGSYTRQLAESILNNLGIKPVKIIELGNSEAIKRMVMKSNTLAFISRQTVSIELQNNLLCQVDSLSLHAKRPFHAIWHKGTRLTPASRAFLDVIRNTAADFKESIKTG